MPDWSGAISGLGVLSRTLTRHECFFMAARAGLGLASI